MPKPPETPSGSTPLDPNSSEFRRLIGSYPVLEFMLAKGIPLTRESYIALNWLEGIEEWTSEHEDDLPPPFRRRE